MIRRATPRPLTTRKIQPSGTGQGRTLNILSPKKAVYCKGPNGTPETLVKETTVPETAAIITAVITTFCSGKRRPSATKVASVAEQRKSPSSQPPIPAAPIPRLLQTTLTSQQSKHKIRTGLCHRSNSRGRSDPMPALTSCPEERCVVNLPDLATSKNTRALNDPEPKTDHLSLPKIIEAASNICRPRRHSSPGLKVPSFSPDGSGVRFKRFNGLGCHEVSVSMNLS